MRLSYHPGGRHGGRAASRPSASPRPAQTLDAIKAKGFIQCGVSTGLAGFSNPGRRRQLVGPRRRRLPCRGRRAVRRRRCGQVHAAHRQGALHRAAVGRGRPAVAQHHLDADPRHRARPRLHRRDLLRRPGLHGAQGARRQERARARRRLGLRAARHHDRAQPRRLFPRQQHELRAGRHRAPGRGPHRLRAGPLRRLHHRPVGPLRRAHGARPTRTITSSCPR